MIRGAMIYVTKYITDRRMQLKLCSHIQISFLFLYSLLSLTHPVKPARFRAEAVFIGSTTPWQYNSLFLRNSQFCGRSTGIV